VRGKNICLEENMKTFIILMLVIFSTIALFAQATYLVGNPALHPGVGFDFEDISAAIIATTSGDTIIVYPGRYQGPQVNFTGKNIYITSRYKYTGDRNDIYNTIIDRRNNTGSAVLFANNTSEAVLNGFTIENGIGEQTNTQNPRYREGGGIYIKWDAQPTILNCVIQHNSASGRGGGVAISPNNFNSPTIFFAGNIIKNNTAFEAGGGFSLGEESTRCMMQAIFDVENKNSIFLNTAPVGMDISSGSLDYMNVVLDTFTVATDDPYYISMGGDFNFSCEHYIIEQEDCDLYISPSGNDANSGLTLNSPLKTIKVAMNRIKSNCEAPNTIHLAPGVYTASGGQIFPVIIKSGVILQGAGHEVTIIDLEQNAGAIYSSMMAKNFKISQLTIRNNGQDLSKMPNLAPICLYGTDNSEISDCHFENNFQCIQTVEKLLGYLTPPRTEPVYFKNLSFTYNTNNVIDVNHLEYAVFENIKILNNSYTPLNLAHQNAVVVRINTHRAPYSPAELPSTYIMSNILIARTYVDVTLLPVSYLRVPLVMAVGRDVNLTLNNATIVNNGIYSHEKEDPYIHLIHIGWGGLMTIYNSIICYNNSNYIAGDANFTGWGTVRIDHTLLEGGPSSVLYNQLIWGEGNIDTYPGFAAGYEGYEEWPYQLSSSSPCVDAGTLGIPDYAWLPVDLMRNARVMGETVDMGAYEYNGVSDFYVDFEGSPLMGDVPLTVQFTDLSVGFDIYAWQWDFDNDGVFDSEEQNPVWVYYTGGYKTVRLVVNNGQGSRVRPDYINPIGVVVPMGALQGVVSSGGVALEGVTVTLGALNTVSNEMGVYAFADVVPDVYVITARKEGYEDYGLGGVVVRADEVTTHNIEMLPVSDSDEVLVAVATGLVGNYPNPFNPSTVVGFNVGKAGVVEISVYNVKGGLVKRLVNGFYGAGKHSVIWDGCDDLGRGVGSGVYFYRMRAGGVVETRKMVLVK